MPLADAQSYPLWLNALLFFAAAIVVWFAAARLTRALDAIADRTGMEQAFVGMLLLGGITSLPEVANVITASAIGNPPLAINNLLGSAAINVLLLAVADAFIGRDAVTSVVAKPSTMMMGTLCMLVLVIVAAAITVGDVALPAVGVGLGGVTITALAIAFFWLAAGHDRRAAWAVAEPDQDEEAEDVRQDESSSSLMLWTVTAISGAIIFVAGYILSQTGDAIATQTGLGSGIVGFALIGVATSMPELSSIITALRIRRYEMAFGQVLGTNFINLSLVLLADGVFTGGPVLNELGPFEVVSALLGAVLTGIYIVGLLERRDRTVFRMGYDSAAVMLVFAMGISLLAGI